GSCQIGVGFRTPRPSYGGAANGVNRGNIAQTGPGCYLMAKRRRVPMDLGIKGKRALVCASSKGLGKGCAEALAAAGVDLVMNARGAEALEATAADIRTRFKVAVTTVAADITTEEGREKVL